MKTTAILMMIALATGPLMGQSAKEIADSLTLPPLQRGAAHLPMPTVPEGAAIVLGGADFEQIIKADGTIMPVISDVPVQVFFKVTKDGETADSKDYEVVVKPSAPAAEGANPKPSTIPSILQWQGAQGSWTPGKVITISCTPDSDLAEMLAADLRQMYPGREVRVVSGDADIKIGPFKGLSPCSEEGYCMEVTPKGVTISCDPNLGMTCFATKNGGRAIGKNLSVEHTALYYGTRTLLQILRSHGGSVPCGTAVDFPRYPLRGFMLDIARTPFTLKELHDVVDLMAWYKMNDLHLVINNNFIFHENYLDAGRDPFKESYSAFRLESNIKGADGTPLTAKDLSYTKKDFRALINYAKNRGVNIVPEFDTPGHALSFTRVRPDLIYQGKMRSHAKRRCEMLDASNPESLNFMDEVFGEYLDPQGEEPAVFAGCVVHGGADEFYGEAEDYRRYMDGLLKIVLKRGYTPRVWGSLSSKPGKTPVVTKGVQMNLWNTGWMKAKEAIDMGFDVINTNDGQLYIVPFANYYRADKALQQRFNHWIPNRVGGELLPAGHPQLLGATFAVWNDTTDLRHNGYGMLDIWGIISESTDVFSQKMWSLPTNEHNYATHRALVAKLGNAPGANPFYAADNKGMRRYTFGDAAAGKHELNQPAVGPNYHLTLMVTLNEVQPGEEQALLSGAEGVLLGVMKDGSIGFRRADGMEFSWDAKLPVGQEAKLELIGNFGKTRLFLNGQEVEKMTLQNYQSVESGFQKRTKDLISTFVLPQQTVGDSFRGTVREMEVVIGSEDEVK